MMLSPIIVTHLVQFVLADVGIQIILSLEDHMLFYATLPHVNLSSSLLYVSVAFLCVTYMYTVCDTIFRFVFFTLWNSSVAVHCRKVNILCVSITSQYR